MNETEEVQEILISLLPGRDRFDNFAEGVEDAITLYQGEIGPDAMTSIPLADVAVPTEGWYTFNISSEKFQGSFGQLFFYNEADFLAAELEARAMLHKLFKTAGTDPQQAEKLLLETYSEIPYWYNIFFNFADEEDWKMEIRDVTYSSQGLQQNFGFTYSLFLTAPGRGNHYLSVDIPSEYANEIRE